MKDEEWSKINIYYTKVNLLHVSSLDFNGWRIKVFIHNTFYMSIFSLWPHKHELGYVLVGPKICHQCSNYLWKKKVEEFIDFAKLIQIDCSQSMIETRMENSCLHRLTSFFQLFRGLQPMLYKTVWNWLCSSPVTGVWRPLSILGILNILLWLWRPEPDGSGGNTSAFTTVMLGVVGLSPKMFTLYSVGSSSLE